jgi:hypothetical protein
LDHNVHTSALEIVRGPLTNIFQITTACDNDVDASQNGLRFMMGVVMFRWRVRMRMMVSVMFVGMMIVVAFMRVMVMRVVAAVIEPEFRNRISSDASKTTNPRESISEVVFHIVRKTHEKADCATLDERDRRIEDQNRNNARSQWIESSPSEILDE